MTTDTPEIFKRQKLSAVAPKIYRADWMNPTLYPRSGASNQEIAWEFMRRDARYALHAFQMRKLVESHEFSGKFDCASPSSLEGLDCIPMPRKCNTVADYFKENKDGEIINPRRTFQNRWCLNLPLDVTQPFSHEAVKFSAPLARINKRRGKPSEACKPTLLLFPNEIAVRLKLDMSLEQQIEQIRTRFQAISDDYFRSATTLPKIDLRTSRNKTTYDDAHFWLRAFDAFVSTPGHEKTLVKPREFLAHINREFEQMNRPTIVQGRVTGWRKSAEAFISERKYLSLLYALT